MRIPVSLRIATAALFLLLLCAAPQCAAARQNGAASVPSRRELELRIEKLEREVAALQAALKLRPTPSAPHSSAAPTSATSAPVPAPVSVAQPPVVTATASQSPAPAASSPTPSLPAGVTLNAYFDGYYSWNTNRPQDRVNQLRSFDAASNNFSLSQAALILERAPDLDQGRRYGMRIDFQFGQTANALQGSPANEPRPQVYLNIFQAYGTYIVPMGKGLSVDFGKWASSLGIEGAYSKDQINYSRSLLYTFLPAYHMGFRATYPVTSWLSASGWLVNGVNQTEDFNGFKSEAVALALKPASSLAWTLNYYSGIENPQNSSASALPTPNGREHIFDTYATWTPTGRLTFAAEGDYAITRLIETAPPSHLLGGAGYFRYQFTPRWALGTRGEYVADPDGLFSGISQDLKEATANLDYQPANGVLLRGEWRTDWSNRSFFRTDLPGQLSRHQTTLTAALIWWFGEKKGSW